MIPCRQRRWIQRYRAWFIIIAVVLVTWSSLVRFNPPNSEVNQQGNKLTDQVRGWNGIHNRRDSSDLHLPATDFAERESRITKLIIASYSMETGSSLLSHFLETDSRTLLWNEPFDQFYMGYFGFTAHSRPDDILYNANGSRRVLDDEERESMLTYVDNLLSCSYDVIPTETLSQVTLLKTSRALNDYITCFSATSANFTTGVNQCKEKIAPLCGRVSFYRRDVDKAIRGKCREVIKWLTEQDIYSMDPHLQEDIEQQMERKMKIDKRILSKFIEHDKCMRTVRKRTGMCLHSATQACFGKPLRVLRTSVLNLEDIERLLSRIPNLKVIYARQDPRSVLTARRHGPGLMRDEKEGAFIREAHMLCDQMTRDRQMFLSLRNQYPSNFYSEQFENLALDFEKAIKNIYHFLNIDLDPNWRTEIKKIYIPEVNIPQLEDETVREICRQELHD